MQTVQQIALGLSSVVIAALFGAIATSQVVYVHEIATGAVPVAPMIRGFIVTVLLVALAPRTTFRTKLLVFCAIYVLELILSVFISAAAVWLVDNYFAGDPEAAGLWTKGGLVVSLITAFFGWYSLRKAHLRRAKRDTEYNNP